MMLTTILVIQAILAIFISGILYAFSDFALRGLNKLPTKSSVEAMQNINVTVYRSLFMVLFFLLTVSSIAIGIWSFVSYGWQDSLFVLFGSLFYVAGVFTLTVSGNVPLNERLRKANSEDADASTIWADYYVRWTRLNSLRSAFGVIAGICWIVAAYLVR